MYLGEYKLKLEYLVLNIIFFGLLSPALVLIMAASVKGSIRSGDCASDSNGDNVYTATDTHSRSQAASHFPHTRAQSRNHNQRLALVRFIKGKLSQGLSQI